MNPLDDYLNQNPQLSQEDFARRAGVVPAMVSLWRAGKRRPGLDSAFAIERATKGAIPVSAWAHEAPPAPKRSRRSR